MWRFCSGPGVNAMHRRLAANGNPGKLRSQADGNSNMVITAMMVRKQQAIVRAFEQAAATTAAMARTAEQLGLKPGMAWHQLVGHAVLRCPGDGRYFLDLANWQRLRQRRRRIALTIIAGLLVVLTVILLTTRAG